MSRYDRRTSTFSPDGRLYQVEYALSAITKAGTVIGIVADDGIVLLGKKKSYHKLLERSSDKIHKIDNYRIIGVSGMTADASILIERARLFSQQHLFVYNEPVHTESLVSSICDIKQLYTQSGGRRPFGVSLLWAGWDENDGFSLYQSDPSGNYQLWRATAIGQNADNKAVQYLKDKYEKKTLVDAINMALIAMYQCISLNDMIGEKLEMATLSLNKSRHINIKIYTEKEIDTIIKNTQFDIKEDNSIDED